MMIGNMVLSLVFLPLLVLGGTDEMPRVNVCDVLADPQRYNGQTLAVRGVAIATGEGSWLMGDSCQSGVVTDGFVWPRQIWLDLSSSGRRHAGVSGEGLREDVRRINAKLRRQRFDVRRSVVRITYLGRLVTYDDFRPHVFRDSSGVRGIGFGHLNAAPAMLVVSRAEVESVEVEKMARER